MGWHLQNFLQIINITQTISSKMTSQRVLVATSHHFFLYFFLFHLTLSHIVHQTTGKECKLRRPWLALFSTPWAWPRYSPWLELPFPLADLLSDFLLVLPALVSPRETDPSTEKNMSDVSWSCSSVIQWEFFIGRALGLILSTGKKVRCNF